MFCQTKSAKGIDKTAKRVYNGIVEQLPDRKEKERMYTKDKSQRITLRLNEDQFEFVRTVADALGVSPSEYLRMMVNLSMVGTQKATAERNGERRANEQTDSSDIVQ